jgi:flavorubredoxin
MAKAVVEGAEIVQGVDTRLMIDFQVRPEALASAEAIIVGMPTYHHDMTRSVKNLFEESAAKRINLKGKIGASFGSYGWSGEAPRLILEILENKFEMDVLKPPLLIKYTPDAKGLDECRNLGKRIAEHVSKS